MIIDINVLLADIHEITDELEDKIFNMGFSPAEDCFLHSSSGKVFVTFFAYDEKDKQILTDEIKKQFEAAKIKIASIEYVLND